MHSTSPDDRVTQGRRSRLRGLIALNGALLIILAAITFGATADAQSRTRGEYTMVAGSAQGANGSIVYIVDAVNQELMAITYNRNTQQLEGVGYRHLGADAAVRLRTR